MRRVFPAFYLWHRRILLGIVAAALWGLAAVTGCYAKIGSYGKFIVQDMPAVAKAFAEPPVGIVPGGGIEHGQPRPLLKDRLDAAAELVKTGVVRKLIVSGDNRVVQYNEPEVMRDYLVNQKAVPADLVQLDNAGRSTYETCERAKKVFGLDRALMISEATHLPRAIYVCRSFGIETYGYKSDGQSAAGRQIGQRWREVLTRTKAAVNVHFWGERTLLGEQIQL